MEAEQLHRSANPNICPSCEQLLEDDSPALMAEIGRFEAKEHIEKLLDEPLRLATPKPEPVDTSAAPQVKGSKT